MMTKNAVDKAIELIQILHNPESGCPVHKSAKPLKILNWTRDELDEIEEELIDFSSEDELTGEIGDAIWNLIVLCNELHKNPYDALDMTVEKMKRRHDFLFDGSPPLSKEEAEKRYQENKRKEKAAKCL